MSVLPEGEQLRKAVRWISEMREERKDAGLSTFINEACIKFDLSPADADFLIRFFSEEGTKK